MHLLGSILLARLVSLMDGDLMDFTVREQVRLLLEILAVLPKDYREGHSFRQDQSRSWKLQDKRIIPLGSGERTSFLCAQAGLSPPI